MNKRIISIIIILILSFVLFAGCINEGEEPEFLKAVGKDILTKNGLGEVILLKGVNCGGYFVMEEWMCPVNCLTQFETEDILYERFGSKAAELLDIYMDNWWTEEDFRNVKEMGFNTVRLPFTYRTLQNPDFTYKANAFARMDSFVNKAAEYGLYVILDLHGAHGSQNGRHHSGDITTGGGLYGSESNMALTEELWMTVARHYRDNPTVAGYDLLNEPEGAPEGTMDKTTPQWAYYDRLYKAIRQIDDNHIIIMEGIWEPMNLPDPSHYDWENVVYQYHFYCWNNSNDYLAQKNFINTKVVYVNSTNYYVPTYIGEFTFFENEDSWKYGLDIFESEGWSYTLWTYKVMGASSWGIYCCLNGNLRVDPLTDTFDEIKTKWSSLKTDGNFTPNQWLYELLKDRNR